MKRNEERNEEEKRSMSCRKRGKGKAKEEL